MSTYLRVVTALFLSWQAREVIAQVPVFEQATAYGGATEYAQSQVRKVVTDKAGNVYTTGIFRGSLLVGSTTLTATGDYDVFVTKCNAVGVYQWAVQAGGSSGDISAGLALDAKGNVHITGYSEGNTAQFGNQKLFTPVSPYDGLGYNLFVATLTPDGTWQRVVRVGGHDVNNYLVGTSLAVDAEGNTYVTGGYRGREATFGTTQLANEGVYNVFVACLAVDGTWRWAVLAGGNGYGFGYDIAVDNQNGVYITGAFDGTDLRLGTNRIVNQGVIGHDGFVAKLTATIGAWQWATPISSHYDDTSRGIAVDSHGDICLAGMLGGGSATVGTQSLSKAGEDADMLVAKFDGATGACRWAVRGGGTQLDAGSAIAVDAEDVCYVTGTISSKTADFGPTRIQSVQRNDIVVASLDAVGTWRWAIAGGGTGEDYAMSIAADGEQGAYVGGIFDSQTATFGSTTLTRSTSSSDFIPDRGFVTRVTDVALRSDAATLTLWPNPSRRSARVWATGLPVGQPVQVFDSVGRLLIADARPAYESQGLLLPPTLASGMYVIRCGKQSRQLMLLD